MEDHLLKINQCLEIIPVARSTWWAGVKNDTFPQPIKINGSTFWKYSELMNWIAAQGSQRRAA